MLKMRKTRGNVLRENLSILRALRLLPSTSIVLMKSRSWCVQSYTACKQNAHWLVVVYRSRTITAVLSSTSNYVKHHTVHCWRESNRPEVSNIIINETKMGPPLTDAPHPTGASMLHILQAHRCSTSYRRIDAPHPTGASTYDYNTSIIKGRLCFLTPWNLYNSFFSPPKIFKFSF